MAKLVTEAIEETNLPLLLYYRNNEFGNILVKNLEKDLKVIKIADKKSAQPNETIIDIKKIKYLEQIKEQFSYCLFFLNEEEDKKNFSFLLKKLDRDKTKTTILIPVRKVEEFYDIILAVKKKALINVIILGDLFDPSLKEKEYFISNFLKNVAVSKAVLFTGDDLLPVFPIHLSDAIYGIEQSLFTQNLNGNIFLLFYENPQTILSVAHILRRIEPELKLNFDKNGHGLPAAKSHAQIIEELRQKTSIMPAYLNLPKNFENRASGFFNGQKNKIAQEIFTDKTARGKKLNVKLKSNPVIRAVIYGALIYLAIFLFSIFLGTFLMYNAANSFKNTSLEKSINNLKAADAFLTMGEPMIALATKFARLLPNESVQNNLQKLTDGKNAAKTLSQILPIIQKSAFGLSQNELDLLVSDSIHLYFLLEKNKESLQKYANLDSQTLNYLHTFTSLPAILGYYSPKTYLVLFQNNGELRPSGGFIGSLAEIKLQNGKITQYKLMDVYQVDGQLKDHVEPHYIVRRYLQPHLYLRDSSFDLDFQETASKAALLYDLETGRKVDGVISVDFEVLKKIIEISGPITLHKYNKTVDSKTAFSFLQDTIESNFFPGSNEKKEVLDTLLNNLLLKIKDNKNMQFLIIRQIPQMLKEKHIMFAFREQSIQKSFNLNGLGGTLQDLRTKEDGEITDVLGINEANIGINKANVDVTKQITYLPSFSGNRLNSTINITYTNSGDKDYNMYLRIIVPKNSRIINVFQNGKLEKITPAITNPSVFEEKGFKKPNALEVDTTIYGDYTTFGFITTIPKHSMKTISINYENGTKLTLSDEVKYSLFYIKQPGTMPYLTSVVIPLPKDFQPKQINEGILKNNTVEFKKEVRSDALFKATFNK